MLQLRMRCGRSEVFRCIRGSSAVAYDIGQWKISKWELPGGPGLRSANFYTTLIMKMVKEWWSLRIENRCICTEKKYWCVKKDNIYWKTYNKERRRRASRTHMRLGRHGFAARPLQGPLPLSSFGPSSCQARICRIE